MKRVGDYFAVAWRERAGWVWRIDTMSVDDDRDRVDREIELRKEQYPENEYRLVTTRCEWRQIKTSDELRKARAAAVRKMFPRRSRL